MTAAATARKLQLLSAAMKGLPECPPSRATITVKALAINRSKAT
jgi:hypothetical protein